MVYPLLRSSQQKLEQVANLDFRPQFPDLSDSIYPGYVEARNKIPTNRISFQSSAVITSPPKSDNGSVAIALGLGIASGIAYLASAPVSVTLTLLAGGALLLTGCSEEESGLSSSMELVSVGLGGVKANGASLAPSISADGRYVMFRSEADNLVAEDRNGKKDDFIRDRQKGETLIMNDDVDNTSLIIEVEGRFEVVYEPDDRFDREPDKMFVRDRQTGSEEKIHIDPDFLKPLGQIHFKDVSADGRYVLFEGNALYSERDGEPCPDYTVCNNGHSRGEVFLHDRQTGISERVSVGSDGVTANNLSDRSSMNVSGSLVVFVSAADNLALGYGDSLFGIYVRDIQAGVTDRLDIDFGCCDSYKNRAHNASISNDGRFIAFSSNSDTIVLDDTNDDADIFVHDRQRGVTKRVSVGNGGVEADAFSGSPAISANGRFVTFESHADNLGPDNARDRSNIFVVGVERFF